jgi:hypothetical protein
MTYIDAVAAAQISRAGDAVLVDIGVSSGIAERREHITICE